MKRDSIDLEFHIGAYEPGTIPMSRLADYLRDLSDLLGEARAVHFVKLKKGSTVVVHRVENAAFSAVRERVSKATQANAPADIREAYQRIEKRLRQDNARGASLRAENSKLLEFPVPVPTPASYHPVSRFGTLQGVVIRMGGTGEWVPVHLEDLDGTIYMCEAKREKTVALRSYYLGQPIRVSGNGRWARRGEGGWDLENFRISDFEPIHDVSLKETFDRLRSVAGEWKQIANPLAVLEQMRRGE